MSTNKQQRNPAGQNVRDSDVQKHKLRATNTSDEHHRLRLPTPRFTEGNQPTSRATDRSPRYYFDASTIIHPRVKEPGQFSAAAREHAARLRRASEQKAEALQATRRALYYDIDTDVELQTASSPQKRIKRSHFAFETNVSLTNQTASEKTFADFDDTFADDDLQTSDDGSDVEKDLADQQEHDTQITFLRSFLCWLCCSEDDSYSNAASKHSRMFRLSPSKRERNSSETDAHDENTKAGDNALRESVSSTQGLSTPATAAAAVNYGPSTTSLAQRNAQKAVKRYNYQQQPQTVTDLLRSDTIHEAARTADMEGLRQLLDMLPNHMHIRRQHINRPDENGTTPLHYAARYHHVQMARLLISLGAHVNARGEFGQTPLHAACRHRARVGRLYSKAAMTFLPSHWRAAELRHARKRQQNEQREQQRISQQQKEDASHNNLRSSYRVEILDKRSFVGVSQARRRRAQTNPPQLMSVIRLLCEAGADVNARDCFGNTPLHIAIMRGNSSAVRELLSLPAVDIQAIDETLSTPLHLASSHGAADIVQMLLKKSFSNPDLRLCDVNSCTPLHLACAQGNFQVVRELLDEASRQQSLASSAVRNCGVNAMLLDRDSTGQIPLGRAVEGGHVRVVQELIERGSPINIPNSTLLTPLHIAAARGDLEMCKIIAETTDIVAVEGEVEAEEKEPSRIGTRRSNASVLLCKRDSQTSHESKATELISVRSLSILLEARNLRLETPLHRATALNRSSVVLYLLSKGADFEARESNSWSPLLVAARNGHAELVRILLEHGANPVAFSKRDRSALFLPALHNHTESIATLLRYLSRNTVQELLGHTDRYGLYPIHVASQCGNIDVLRMLVEAGGTELVDERLYDEKTAMHSAAQYGRSNVVSYLATINDDLLRHEDEQGNTPLHLAAANGHFSTVTVLISLLDAGEATFDASERNVMHWTALDCAAARGHAQVCHALLRAGAPLVPSKKISFATTPLHLACVGGNFDTVKLLLNAHERNQLSLAARDPEGQNCLDLAINFGRSEIAALLVQSSRWQDLLRNEQVSYASDNSGNLFHAPFRETPLRKLIRSMPDVAYKALNMCMQSNNALASREFKIMCDFEFVDDTFSHWIRSELAFFDKLDQNFVGTASYYAKSDPILYSGGSGYHLLTVNRHSGNVHVRLLNDGYPYTDDRKVLTENHPLKLMVLHKREKLLTHPLVLALLDQKWLFYGQYAFYFTFVTYVLFLACLTAYCLQTVPINRLFWHTDRDVERRIMYAWWADDICPENTPWPLTGDVNQLDPEEVCQTVEQYGSVIVSSDSQTVTVSVNSAAQAKNQSFCSMQFVNSRQEPPASTFIRTNQYMLCIISLVLLVKEFVEVLGFGTAEDWLPAPVYALALLTSIPWRHNCLDRAGIKLSWEWQIMSFNIVLAYMRFVLLMRHVPWFGLYVQMLSDVAVSVLRFLPVGALVMLAFNFALYVALQGSARHLHTPDPLVDRSDDAKNINPFFAFFVGAFPKMMTMLVGEYTHQLHFFVTNQPIIQVIYGLYLVPTISTILNMITGLSIQDLKRVREAAMLKRIAMRIDMALSVERMTPMSIRARKFKMKIFVYPNRRDYIGGGGEEDEVNGGEKPQEQAADHVAAQKEREDVEAQQQHERSNGWWSRARAVVAAAVGDTHADVLDYNTEQQQQHSAISVTREQLPKIDGTDESRLDEVTEPFIEITGQNDSKPVISELEAMIESIRNVDDEDHNLLSHVESKLAACKQTILQAMTAATTSSSAEMEIDAEPMPPIATIQPANTYEDKFLFRETDEDALMTMEEPDLIITNVDANNSRTQSRVEERNNNSFLYESTRDTTESTTYQQQ